MFNVNKNKIQTMMASTDSEHFMGEKGGISQQNESHHATAAESNPLYCYYPDTEGTSSSSYGDRVVAFNVSATAAENEPTATLPAMQDHNGNRQEYHQEIEPEQHWRPKRSMRVMLFLVVLIWAIFLYYMVATKAHVTMDLSVTSPVLPDNDNWWFMTISWWPTCSNLKSEAWRLISMQFVHAGLGHIFGNTLIALWYGFYVECYHHNGLMLAPVVFELAVVFGCMAQSITYPFMGLVGCSAGVYGLIGVTASMILCDRDKTDRGLHGLLVCVLLCQVVFDVLAYTVLFASTTAHLAHVAGCYCGFSLGLASYYNKPAHWKRALALLGVLMFILQVLYLSQYAFATWPPVDFTGGSNKLIPPFTSDGVLASSSGMVQSCCLGYFQLISGTSANYTSMEDVMRDYYCNGLTLIKREN